MDYYCKCYTEELKVYYFITVCIIYVQIALQFCLMYLVCKHRRCAIVLFSLLFSSNNWVVFKQHPFCNIVPCIMSVSQFIHCCLCQHFPCQLVY